MIVSDKTIEAECLADLFKSIGGTGLNAPKKDGKKVLENLGKALEFGANVGKAFAP